MKRTAFILSGLLLAFLLSVTAMAADGPAITMQPQNPHYPEYSVAIYTVKADGENLTCTWYMDYEGSTYNISNNRNAIEPWEGYAGSSYGPSQTGNTFNYIFNGIESGLNGAEIYCVIKDGSKSVESDRAYITVIGKKMPPNIVNVPAKVTAHLGEEVDIRCVANSPNRSAQLTYTWYETSTGKLPNITALSTEPEYSDYWTCDTSAPGTRYYVCGVQSSNGGMAYSSVIPVTVTGRMPAFKATKITTLTLPDASAGEKYNVQLECNDSNAEFSVVYMYGEKNDFGKTGLKLSEDGIISGTPTKTGEYTFTVSADGVNGEDSVTYTLKVNEALKPITSVAITDIEAPVAGKSPDCFGNVGGKGYTFPKSNAPDSFNGISWYDITEGRYIALAEKFIAGHEYQLYAELITEGSYAFNNPDGTVNKQAAEVFGNTGAITVCYIFPPCKAAAASSGAASKTDKVPPASQQEAPPAQPESKPSSSEASQPSASSEPPKAESAPVSSSAAVEPSSTVPASSSAVEDKTPVSAPSSAVEDKAPVSAPSSAVEDKTPVSAPSSAVEDKTPVSAPSAESQSGMPMWGVILCSVSAAAAGVAITLAAILMKKSKK